MPNTNTMIPAGVLNVGGGGCNPWLLPLPPACPRLGNRGRCIIPRITSGLAPPVGQLPACPYLWQFSLHPPYLPAQLCCQ